MRYCRILLFTIIPFVLISCLNLRSCPEEIFGKFICYNNSNAENYLFINKDGTFHHYYKEDDLVLEQRGTWKRSNDGYCKIEFNQWNNYNEKGSDFQELKNGLFWINGKYLDNTPDGNDHSSFVKSKK